MIFLKRDWYFTVVPSPRAFDLLKSILDSYCTYVFRIKKLQTVRRFDMDFTVHVSPSDELDVLLTRHLFLFTASNFFLIILFFFFCYRASSYLIRSAAICYFFPETFSQYNLRILIFYTADYQYHKTFVQN